MDLRNASVLRVAGAAAGWLDLLVLGSSPHWLDAGWLVLGGSPHWLDAGRVVLGGSPCWLDAGGYQKLRAQAAQRGSPGDQDHPGDQRHEPGRLQRDQPGRNVNHVAEDDHSE